MKYSVVFERVTKRYYQGKKSQPSFRDWIDAVVKGRSFSKPKFKALDNVNFKIKRGEVVGFVGSNGAGKSTILKLISKITYPNEGEVKINGSTAGLLELGTGFHPELSGKENIFLYAAILGLEAKKVELIYDDIVDFSGIDRKFLNSPIKHYSSGMMARIGFSVAVHLNPNILVIDEVLAVGDIAFRNKCMHFMKNYCKDPNRTVVFVSHNSDQVKMICDRVIWLEQGKVKMDGKTDEVLRKYINYQEQRV